MKNIYICTYKANYDITFHNKEIKEGQIFTRPKDDCLKRLMHQGKITKLSELGEQ